MTEDPIFVSKSALSEELADEFRRRVLASEECVRFTLVRIRGTDGAMKESLRPVRIKGEIFWQLERLQDRKATVRNYKGGTEAAEALETLLAATGAREYHLTSVTGDLHVRVTKKGRILETRGKSHAPLCKATSMDHDREKALPLSVFDSSPLLKALGLADKDGRICASMRGKYDQINAFLRELDTLLATEKYSLDEELNIVDCGCGRAYLTLAAYCYLSARGMKVRVRGVDRDPELVAAATGLAEALDVAADVKFVAADIATCQPDLRPELVLSLHACDTATDLALARAVDWGARFILAAPCCQHDLQTRLKEFGGLSPLLRHGILRERMADLLTDAFRAQLLRLMGFRVRIVEFVSAEATAKNIMIRAVRGIKKFQTKAVDEYLEMRDTVRVTPILEKLLLNTRHGGQLEELLS